MHQSCSRYCTRGVARPPPPPPRSASQATILRAPSMQGIPSNAPEFISTPSSETIGNFSPATATTWRMGSLNWVANSKSRLSCAGTAMIALVGLHRRALLDGRELIHERMLGREHEVGRAEHRVGPCGEDRDLLAARRLEHELGTVAPADPVPLEQDGGG